MDRNMVDVVIVGAGPVGLSLAADLRRYGVSVRIVDRKAGPEVYSKAANFWPRTQEVAEAIGYGAQVQAAAVAIKATTVYAFGSLLGTIPARSYHEFGTPFPQVLAVSQGQVEHIVRDYLEAQGQAVEYGVKFVSLQQDNDGLDVVLERNGQREQLRCRYLVGCDGSKSSVREAMGIPLHLQPLQGRGFQQIDARLRWSRPATNDQMWFFLYDDGFAGIVPLPNNLYRFFVVRDLAKVPDRDPTVEEMTALVQQISGDTQAAFFDPVWFSHGILRYGVAGTFRRGRVLLAGDAGHATVPIGGQGMNSGIQDAFNLGWKLAAVVHGTSPDWLLDTYAQERRKVRSDLAADQKSNFVRLSAPGPLLKALTRNVGAWVLQRGGSVELGRNRDESQLDIAYPDSLLNDDQVRKGNVRVGQRAPDAVVTRASDLSATTVFHDLYAGQWALLGFDAGQDQEHLALYQALDLCSDVAHIRPRLVLARPRVPQRYKDQVLFDVDRLAHTRYGVSQPMIYLVRPDGYIGYRGLAANIGALRAYIARVFPASNRADVLPSLSAAHTI
jgi:3-(3-hydroxy-phenyl)propionate hydroxylase